MRSRLQWKLGVVKTTYPGRDGKVRACDAQIANGTVLKRPVHLANGNSICFVGSGACKKFINIDEIYIYKK